MPTQEKSRAEVGTIKFYSITKFGKLIPLVLSFLLVFVNLMAPTVTGICREAIPPLMFWKEGWRVFRLC